MTEIEVGDILIRRTAPGKIRATYFSRLPGNDAVVEGTNVVDVVRGMNVLLWRRARAAEEEAKTPGQRRTETVFQGVVMAFIVAGFVWAGWWVLDSAHKDAIAHPLPVQTDCVRP